MTQEHREQFLATEGWQQTERGHIRVNEYFDVHDPMPVPRVMRFYVRANMHQTHRKFRRFPFGRQPKHDALVGWFDLGDKLLDRGGLRELNDMASKTGAYQDVLG